MSLHRTPSEPMYAGRRRQPARPQAGPRELPLPKRGPEAPGTSERAEHGQPPPRLRQDEAAQLPDETTRAGNRPREKYLLLKMPIHQLCHEEISTVFFFHCKKKTKTLQITECLVLLCFENPKIKVNDRKTYLKINGHHD